jgi:trimeric autotransporter adhesin
LKLRRLGQGAAATAIAAGLGIAVTPSSAAFAQTVTPPSSSQTIETVAGTGIAGSAGNGVPAVQAELHNPGGVALDTGGALYIADTGNNEIRKVAAPGQPGGGVITTVAGTGAPGLGGDDGPATAALLRYPEGVAVDNSGDLFIADTGNNRVREVLPDGTIKTFAGDGACSLPFGHRGPHHQGSGPGIGDGGAATSASLCDPTGVAVDGAGNVYIADAGHHIVRVVNLEGAISTFAGTGMIGRSGDGGPATKAELGYPVTVAVGPGQTVFIADAFENNVREVNAQGIISTIAGARQGGYWKASVQYGYWDGRFPRFGLDQPRGLGVDQFGDVFIGDTGHNRILELNSSGQVSVFAGTGRPGYSGDGGSATKARLLHPQGSFALDPVAGQSVLYFSDTGNQRVRGIFGGPPTVLPESSTPALFVAGACVIFGGAGLMALRRRRQAEGS